MYGATNAGNATIIIAVFSSLFTVVGMQMVWLLTCKIFRASFVECHRILSTSFLWKLE